MRNCFTVPSVYMYICDINDNFSTLNKNYETLGVATLLISPLILPVTVFLGLLCSS